MDPQKRPFYPTAQNYTLAPSKKVVQPLHENSSQDNATQPPITLARDPTDKAVSDVTQQPSTINAPIAATSSDGAADMIRQKLNRIYAHEPDVKVEQREADAAVHPSKHQLFMHELSQSGKSFVQIQTDWHAYYAALPEEEKHQVWQEFYTANTRSTNTPYQATHQASERADQSAQQPQQPVHERPTLTAPGTFKSQKTAKHKRHDPSTPQKRGPNRERTVADIKTELLGKIQSNQKMTAKQHYQSLIFGLSMGCLALLIMLFGFFNDRILAPFMTPSRAIADSSIIIDPANTKVGDTSQIIIPKINVQIPVVYDIGTINESDVQHGLERGVVHYATTPNPGEKGNAVLFGHSANNILNRGSYKFAFVLLHKMELGDTFYIDYKGTRYVYQIFDRKIVDPTEVSVLDATEKPATMTLITCDPPGTSLKRLIVVGQQITPDPTKNTASSATKSANGNAPTELPSNAPTLWSRLWSWL